MPKMKWSELSKMQLGRFAEHYATMEFVSYGYDVYSAEVDDKGIDFIIKINTEYYEVQVKSARNFNYTCVMKDKMDIEDKYRLVCLLHFIDDNLPEVYVIPANAWQTPNPLLRDNRYEWGINIVKKNMEILENYKIENLLLPNIFFKSI